MIAPDLFYKSFGNWRREVMCGFATVILTFGGLGGWSAYARLDAAVMANGSVGVETDRKAIQHLEGGVVEAILVNDGDRVKEGDILLRINPMQSRALASIAESQMLQALGDQARFVAEIEDRPTIEFGDELLKGGPGATRVMADETRQLQEARRARDDQIDIAKKRSSETSHQIDGVKDQLAATRRQMASIDRETERIKPLVDAGLVTSTRVTTLDRTRDELEGRAGSLESDAARLSETVESTQLEIDQIKRKAVEDAGAKLADANVRFSEARDRLSVQNDAVRRSDLRAPRSGRIVNLKAHTVGAVIRPGDTVMEIVPDEDRLVITARLAPVDVVHVWPGLQAEVKLPSFHSRTTPIAIGEVLSVSADALEDARHEPYYELKVSVQTKAFPEEIRGKLRPGMPAEVLVATGDRTALNYLIQPLADAMHRGMREN